MKLRLTAYKVADPGWRAMWNRYYRCAQGREVTIGAGVVLWRWCLSLRWRSV